MGLFKRRKKEEEIDNRTEIEKDFEEKGRNLGRKTGEFVQKGLNKYEEVKQKLEVNGTMDKVRNIGDKVDDTIDKVVDQVTKQGQKVAKKIGKKDEKAASKNTTEKDEIFYD